MQAGPRCLEAIMLSDRTDTGNPLCEDVPQPNFSSNWNPILNEGVRPPMQVTDSRFFRCPGHSVWFFQQTQCGFRRPPWGVRRRL